MILSLVIWASIRSDSISDFFPLKEGVVRKYEQKKGGTVLLETRVGAPLDQGGVSVYPIVTSGMGGSPQTTCYRVDDNQVLVVAYDVKHPLTIPMPMVKFGHGKVEWDYEGKTKTGPEGERLLAHGEARDIGLKDYLGKKVEVIEVKMTARLGIGMSSVLYEQKMLYGKGIGLAEWSSKTTLGKGRPSAPEDYRIVEMEEPKGSD